MSLKLGWISDFTLKTDNNCSVIKCFPEFKNLEKEISPLFSGWEDKIGDGEQSDEFGMRKRINDVNIRSP